MKYDKSLKYDQNYIQETIMGPNPIKLLEELLAAHPLETGSIVLDLGCGCGISSHFLVREYGLKVFATDLWISASDNWKRFEKAGLNTDQIIPIHAEAHALPFADAFFDAVVCIDAYQYFGCDEEYLGRHLLPLVKPGGKLLIAVPGLTEDFQGSYPDEMMLSWKPDDLTTMKTMEYWRKTLEKTDGIDILSIHEMEGFEECWNDWLACENAYAVSDRASMHGGAGQYMNFIAMVLQRK